MSPGVRLRCLLIASPHMRLWRGLNIGLLIALLSPLLWSLWFLLFLWFSSRLSIWAQPATPRLIFTEVHPKPKAVDDSKGEWIEITNPGADAVNLLQWSVSNQGNDQFVIPFDLWLPPGGYLVLARAADPAQNGGVTPSYVYAPFTIANAYEQLTLRDPEGMIVDSVAWGEGTSLVVTRGASLERSASDGNAPWVTAHSPWPGSDGDLGSPGQPYSPPPTPTPTATPPPDIPPRLLLSEIMANPAAASDEMGEWIELYNGDSFPINLNGWVLADQDDDETTLSGDIVLAPGSYLVVARSSDPAQNGGVVVALNYSGLQLANEQDELLLITPWGVQVDEVVWDEETNRISEGASLERTAFDSGSSWATAYSAWPGSAGDRGSPGAPYASPPPTATPTATASPTPTATPPPAIPPRLLLSELMVNPAAVNDDGGEWVELFNGDSVPINLNGWILADQGRDHSQLNGDFWLPPGTYAVIARNSDAAQNGGVTAALAYTGLQLANEEDEVLLIAPWGVQVDQVLWNQQTLKVREGASIERTAFGEGAAWVTAHAPWPNSAGDLGSPGAPYSAPTATPPPTSTESPTPPPAPSATPTPTLSPTPLPAHWGRRDPPSPLQIEQVYPFGSDQEYVVLRNVDNAALTLAGWRLGDAEFPGDHEGLLSLPDGLVLAPGATWVAARNGAAFQASWGRAADAEWGNSDPALPQLLSDALWASGEMALADDGDELLLLDPAGTVADAVAWKDGDYGALGLAGHLDLPNQSALVQAPDVPYLAVGDVRHRFMMLPPNPFGRFSLPTLNAHPPVALDGGMVAEWGSLGAASTFSPGGVLPPHLLLAAAASLGLDFIAIADRDRAPNDMVTSAALSKPVALPAWRWQDPDGSEAIIYSEGKAILLGWGELFDYLNQQNALAQLPASGGYTSQHTPLLAADDISAPGGLSELQKSWRTMEVPLLPAGNTTPPLPGGAALTPRYSGLATSAADAPAIMEALAQRRGWLTSAPGLWLTLRTAGGEWMGSAIAPANELSLEIAYGDSSGAVAGLALWQGDQLLSQLDLPPADGHWRTTIAAAPGAMIYVVATQADGDFAVTAPLYVQPAAGGMVQINELLPAPDSDWNGDGEVNTGDEYIELFNSGSAPLALAGYALGDAASTGDGHRFHFGANDFIGAGQRLLLWRAATGLTLNDDGDLLQLQDAEGIEIDSISWDKREDGASISRVPDGGEWQTRTPPTPGQPNQSFPPPQVSQPDNTGNHESNQDGNSDDDDDEYDRDEDHNEHSSTIDATDTRNPLSPSFGQAPGIPGSLALAKVRGLQAVVEFRAQVVAPPGLYPSAIYLADAALDANGAPMPVAGLGVQVYLKGGDFVPMQEGDWVLVRGGVIDSFRGELEVEIDSPEQAWPYEHGSPLAPLPITVSAIGESLEGRLVTFTGIVTSWQGDSLYLSDPTNPEAPSVRVTVRSSLGWKRPYVQKGQQFQVTGIVSQFGTTAPWNDGYRVLVRYETDLVRIEEP